jgi:hypothetical protein
MPVVVEDNDMEGKSVYLSDESDIPEVPRTHRALAGPDTRAVLRDPLGYVRRLARGAGPAAFRAWLLSLAEEADSFVVELHKTPLTKGMNLALLRFFLPNETSPAIRLGASPETDGVPVPLASVYERISGTNHFGYGLAGGLEKPPFPPLSKLNVWFGEGNEIPPFTTHPFYGTLSGDLLCYQPPDKAVWYFHETGTLRKAGPLARLVKQYFDELRAGRALEAPY